MGSIIFWAASKFSQNGCKNIFLDCKTTILCRKDTTDAVSAIWYTGLLVDLVLSQQASWMIRRIVAAQAIWRIFHQPLKAGKGIIRQIYLQLLEVTK
ncbi:hypothetical protein H5410_051289 [Solanum commersonii]|uniref:Uncharacterized protein n=1 Tax=Solanum commersonii TaxID=4109 RepID=A0A9J5X0A7_SOLCO|nr:hypothetical protein H5410_051289 [Solanum commersonii]